MGNWAIVIPWQDRGSPDRRRYFEFVEPYYRSMAVAEVYIGTYRFSPGKPLNLSRLRNEGAKQALAAGAEVLLFIDADIIIPRPQVIATLEAATSGGPVLPCDLYRTSLDDPTEVLNGTVDPVAAIDLTKRPRDQTQPLPWEQYFNPTFAVSAALHQQIGGSDEGYIGYGEEEKDFLARAVIASGHPLRFMPGGILHLGSDISEMSGGTMLRSTAEWRLLKANQRRYLSMLERMETQ